VETAWGGEEMSELRKYIKQQIIVDRSKGYFNACDLYTEILAKLIDDKARIKELEEIIYEESREHSHSCRCSLCEVWKEREDATQSTHNAPKPPEEGDCIGGEGGGCEREY
jgi:hypothetical protein